VKFKQLAALPYRMRDDDLEILQITTRKKRRWSVPKGWPMKQMHSARDGRHRGF
jgi:hypothetical protein